MGSENTRDERLAAKLRENLRRRKVQSRAMEPGATGAAGTPQPGADLPAAPDAALPKLPPSG